MLMEMVDILDHPSVEPAADSNVIEGGEVLDELTQPDTTGMRADRDAELRRQQLHRDHLVDPSEPAGVDLADADRIGLEQLLEHYTVVNVLPGRDPDRGDGAGDHGVAEDVVRARRLLDPVRVE